MLSPVDLDNLIAVKRLELEKEKAFLGLPLPEKSKVEDVQPPNKSVLEQNSKRSVKFSPRRELRDDHVPRAEKKEESDATQEHEVIPADLERYIRRYLGLPVMLKAGEYSPNNPLVRGERPTGDVLLGLGEYERRRNTLRRLRQQQYREYLDQQAKKKQEEKEQAERERREREQREREFEEREREREQQDRERQRAEKERQRSERERERQQEGDRLRRLERERYSPERRRTFSTSQSNKVDTGVQVSCRTTPLSVAVQTDDDLFRLPSPTKKQLTQAERELSPHTVVTSDRQWPIEWNASIERRRSYGDFDERCSTVTRKSNRDKLTADLRHSYMPSIFDADAIHMRNMQAEKEAAARRQFYQQELKNQIMEQQRIREERKNREKMLEQAEMRRLEEQLRMLRVAKCNEIGRQQRTEEIIKEDALEYETKRKELQKDIDIEQLKLKRTPLASQMKNITTPKTDSVTKLPIYPILQDKTKESLLQDTNKNAPLQVTNTDQERPIESMYTDRLNYEEKKNLDRKPYSTNIPDDSIFSPNYDVDSYLRRNLNFKDRFEFKNSDHEVRNIENVLRPKRIEVKPVPKERSSLNKKCIDSLPIPVLRHSPLSQVDKVENSSEMSEAMKKVDDKWKVPAVQKNILKSIPNDEGKNVSILTQLGSIRRQLQLEQLKLDGLSHDDPV